jgi:hypothetical protein
MKQFETSILLTGSESPALAKAMASGSAQLKKISKIANQTSKQMSQLGLNAAGISPKLQKGEGRCGCAAQPIPGQRPAAIS